MPVHDPKILSLAGIIYMPVHFLYKTMWGPNIFFRLRRNYIYGGLYMKPVIGIIQRGGGGQGPFLVQLLHQTSVFKNQTCFRKLRSSRLSYFGQISKNPRQQCRKSRQHLMRFSLFPLVSTATCGSISQGQIVGFQAFIFSQRRKDTKFQSCYSPLLESHPLGD